MELMSISCRLNYPCPMREHTDTNQQQWTAAMPPGKDKGFPTMDLFGKISEWTIEPLFATPVLEQVKAPQRIR